jgi:uncharacterized protein (TIGR03437 family)
MKVWLSSALAIAVCGVSATRVDAQGLYGRNLIVNGDAETGSASDGGATPVASIPGWTRGGNADVVLWNQKNNLNTTQDAGPATPGTNYFTGGPGDAGSSNLSQNLDISAGGPQIDAGEVSFDLSAYVGGMGGDYSKLVFTFLGAAGNNISTVTLGPIKPADMTTADGMMWRRQIGLVPASARSVNVTATFVRVTDVYNNGAVDNVVFMLKYGGSEFALYGPNLVTNGDAEAGPNTGTGPATVRDVPGWVRTSAFNVLDYEGNLQSGDLVPVNVGQAFFSGGATMQTSTATQDLDVAAAAISIDAGKVGYNLSALLGGNGSYPDNATVTLRFMNWSGLALGQTVLGPVTAADRNNVSGLLARQQGGGVLPGTRWIRVLLTMTGSGDSYNHGSADNVVLILHGPAPAAPAISGVISLSDFGALPSVTSGSLLEIYGSNMATSIRKWSSADFNGINAPASLDGVSATVAGKPAFINYISPGQVNIQAPDGIGTGPVPIVLKNAAGTTNSFTMTALNTAAGMLAPAAFKLDGRQYVAAFVGPDYKSTFALPVGAITGVGCRPARPGEAVVIYGVGFGPVTPNIPSGTLPSGTNSLTNHLEVMFGTTPATVQYAGLSSDIGVYQINVVVPPLADNDAVPLTFNLGGVASAQTLYIAVHQ